MSRFPQSSMTMRRIESGARNTPMTLQKQIVVDNEHGQQEEVFVNVGALLYGHVRWLDGNELMEARRLGARKPVEITTLYRKDITEDDQLVFGGETVKITSVQNVGQRNTKLLIEGEARPDG